MTTHHNNYNPQFCLSMAEHYEERLKDHRLPTVIYTYFVNLRHLYLRRYYEALYRAKNPNHYA